MTKLLLYVTNFPMNLKEVERKLLEMTGLSGKSVRSMTFHFEVTKMPTLTVMFNDKIGTEFARVFEVIDDEYEIHLTKKNKAGQCKEA